MQVNNKQVISARYDLSDTKYFIITDRDIIMRDTSDGSMKYIPTSDIDSYVDDIAGFISTNGCVNQSTVDEVIGYIKLYIARAKLTSVLGVNAVFDIDTIETAVKALGLVCSSSDLYNALTKAENSKIFV